MSSFDVKKITGFLRERWAMCTFIGVAGLAVPAMVYFATTWSEKNQAEYAAEIKKDSDLYGKTDLSYSVPPILASERAVELKFAPNEKLIEKFKAARDAQAAEASGLIAAAVAVNKSDHAPLIEGLLPSPPEGDQVKAKMMNRRFAGPAQEDLLKTIDAGDPVDPKFLADVLRDQRFNLLQRMIGNDAKDENKLTEPQREQLSAELVKHRVEQYRLKAQKVGVYANKDVFANKSPGQDNTPPSLDSVWDWQMQYWVQSDIIKAIGRANASAKNIGVTRSVVKRIDSISISGGLAGDPNAGGGMPSPFGNPNPAPAPAAPGAGGDGAPDYAASITGRKTGALYDVRTVTLSCVVSTKDFPKFLDALSATNLMTVTKVTLSSVNPVTELASGYYYGDDHVSRAQITIETIWLREWTKQWMPPNVKVTLGLEAPPAPASPVVTPAGG